MVDKDLLSVQEARSLVRAARVAQAEYCQLGQDRIDAVVKAISEATSAQAEALAQMAHEETGYGKTHDKKIKNLLASKGVYAAIKDMKTMGVLREDPVNKITDIAVPVGVIAGVVPSTNPTSTVIYKSLISLKAGNAIVFTPHPAATKCIARTVEIIKDALLSCGVSTDLVSSITVPTIEGSAELMKIADLILATGGPGMVKAAYSSGTPALGVGAGNVPAYIERSADIEDAVTKIFASKTFDNGTICASEQSIVTEACIADKVKQCVIAHGGFFLEGENLAKVKAIMERGNGSMNPAIVGRDAQTLARLAGITIREGTKLLISEEKGVGKKVTFSKEKLTALL
ncbi:MAG: aldehyde dehydrogenase family protein, partial [Mailhella sp.]|nr:aldehyde dehydrogenase family protein [Mailhella sp.]